MTTKQQLYLLLLNEETCGKGRNDLLIYATQLSLGPYIAMRRTEYKRNKNENIFIRIKNILLPKS